MGVPTFYRWLVTKYPSIVVNAVEAVKGEEEINTNEKNPNGIEFDNLYVDMNGIIHPCFHPEDHLFPPTTSDEVFKGIFEYIDRLFRIVRPRKLLYLAIDGVAPRAKMNHQRSRRFRTAKDAEIAEAEEVRLRKLFEMEGKRVLPKLESEISDPNVITPGTEFMAKLSKALQGYIHLRLNYDPGWKDIKVILSDANVPGEGEHKIKNFIRLQRNLPGYDPNTRHCLYGLDADLIMLALATHELHFSILREDMFTQVQQPISISSLESSLSKADVKSRGWFSKVGSNNAAVGLVKKPYQFLNIWTLREYLELDLQISDPPFSIDFERIVDDFICMCLFVGNDFLPHMPTLQINEGAIDLLMAVYRDEFKSRGGYLVDMEKVEEQKAAYVKLKRMEKFILAVGNYEDKIFKKRCELQQRKLKKFLRENANDIDNDQFTEEVLLAQAPIDSLSLESKEGLRGTYKKTLPSITFTSSTSTEDSEAILQNTKELNRRLKDFICVQSDILKQGGFGDKVKLGMQGWRERYYKEKFKAENPIQIEHIRKDIVEKYMKGICWVLQYYFSRVPSWTWYFSDHYGPFASDFKGLGKIDLKFKMGTPFKPFEQLMGVLPPKSFHALPKVYWNLMTSEESVLKDFYPTDFEVDVDGKRFLWQGIVKLDFIDEERLLLEVKKLENELKDDEIKRNSEGKDVLFINRSHALGSQVLYFKRASSRKQEAKLRDDVIASDGINGFLHTCGEDLASTLVRVKGMEDVLEDNVLSVLFDLPNNHSHIPRLPENVHIPEKTITEGDIVKMPLWHEYEGWTPDVRPQLLQRYKQLNSTDLSSTREVWKEAGSGWSSTGRGKSLQSSMMNQFSTGVGSSYTGTSMPSSSPNRGRGHSGSSFSSRTSESDHSTNRAVNSFASPSYISDGRGRTGVGSSNRRSLRGNEVSGISTGGRGSSSGSRGGSRTGDASFWPSRNVSTDDPQYKRTSGRRW